MRNHFRLIILYLFVFAVFATPAAVSAGFMEPSAAGSVALQQAYQTYSVCYKSYLELLKQSGPSQQELQQAREQLQTATEAYAQLLGVDISQLDATMVLPPPTVAAGDQFSSSTVGSIPMSGLRDTRRSSAADSSTVSRLYEIRRRELQQTIGQRAATAEEKQVMITRMVQLANQEAHLGFWDFLKKWKINSQKRELGRKTEKVNDALLELTRRENLLKGELVNLGRLRTSRFVQTSGAEFFYQGEPFVPFGFNSYDLFTQNPTDRVDPTVYDEIFRTLSSRGVNLVRTWVFNSGQWHGFHTSVNPAVYGTENQWQILDAMIESAAKYKIHLLLCLGNYWKDYGGVPWYLKQCGLPADPDKPDQLIEFYRNREVKAVYREYLRHVISRTNSRTGIPYREDPTIFAWELLNEPRCPADSSGETLRNWIDEMGRYVRSLDPEHMISAGLEGSDPDFSGGNEGTPYVYLHQSPYLSFATVHLYPEYHFPKISARKASEIISNYLDATQALAWTDPDGQTRIGKPFLLEESNVRKDWRLDYWSTLVPLLQSRQAGFLLWNYFQKPSTNADEFAVTPADVNLFDIVTPH